MPDTRTQALTSSLASLIRGINGRAHLLEIAHVAPVEDLIKLQNIQRKEKDWIVKKEKPEVV